MSTGTTTLGIVYKDGILIGADKRATAGNMIADKDAQKVHLINDRFVLTIAGNVSDAQLLLKLLRVNINLNETKRDRDLLVSEVANMLASYVYSSIRKMSVMTSITQFLLAGYDSTGVYFYDIFPDGTLTKIDSYYSSGSGSPYTFGVLESSYKENLSEKEAINLGLNAFHASLSRDSASGNGIVLYVVKQGKIEKVLEKNISIDLKNN